MYKVIIIAGILVALLGGGYWFANKSEAPTTSDLSNSESAMSDSSAESVATLESGTYEVDEENSTIVWEAGKPAITGYVHTGSFSLSDGGKFIVTDSTLSGEATIDMNSIEVISLGGGKEGQESALEGHLKGERFFDVAKYPTATFKVTDISPKVLPGPEHTEYTATGELTMKGVTKTINFPVKVTTTSATEAWMKADFSIDRTAWGITAGSAKIAEKITDQIIGDTVNLDLSIKLTK